MLKKLNNISTKEKAIRSQYQIQTKYKKLFPTSSVKYLFLDINISIETNN